MAGSWRKRQAGLGRLQPTVMIMASTRRWLLAQRLSSTLNGPQLFSKPTFECRIEGQGKRGARRGGNLAFFFSIPPPSKWYFCVPALGR